jgi:hypothetical protein
MFVQHLVEALEVFGNGRRKAEQREVAEKKHG